MTCRAPMGMHRVDKSVPGSMTGMPKAGSMSSGRSSPGFCCAWGVLLCVGLTEANVDADIFNLWLEHDLIPGLPSKAVSVMDRATFHRRGDTKP